MRKLSFAAAVTVLAPVVVAFSIVHTRPSVPQEAPYARRFFVVDGADFRGVTPVEFAEMRSSCLRIERKRYPVERVDVNLCNI